MTKDDIIRMAKEANWPNWDGDTPTDEHEFEDFSKPLERFASIVATNERESIAQIIENAPALVKYVTNDKGGCLVCGFTPKLAAYSIRNLRST